MLSALLSASWPLFGMGTVGLGSRGACCSLQASFPSRVLSSEFLALCTRHPSLVVELAKELLEFLGGTGGLRSGASMLSSVVSQAVPVPLLTWGSLGVG